MLRLVIIAALLATPASAQFRCDKRKTCGRMLNCAEAVYQLRQCGATKRDGDKDGIPCESICGKTKAQMNRKLANNRKVPGS